MVLSLDSLLATLRVWLVALALEIQQALAAARPPADQGGLGDLVQADQDRTPPRPFAGETITAYLARTLMQNFLPSLDFKYDPWYDNGPGGQARGAWIPMDGGPGWASPYGGTIPLAVVPDALAL
jgi:hypothetical protein